MTYEVSEADLRRLASAAGEAVGLAEVARSWRTKAEATEADNAQLRTQVQHLTDEGRALRDKLRLATYDTERLTRQLADAESLLLLR